LENQRHGRLRHASSVRNIDDGNAILCQEIFPLAP
jgi:hypothetical protein